MATITREPMSAWTAEPGLAPLPALPAAQCAGREPASPATRRGCGASSPIRDGMLVVRDTPTDDNKIAADFYNGELWPKVRFWERLFWFVNGASGERVKWS